MKKEAANLCEGPLAVRLLLYTVPIILTGILQLLFNAADLIVVGQYCGSECVGAIGVTGPLINLIVNLFIGLSVGAGVTVAHAYGSHFDEDARRTVHTEVPLAVICGIVLTVVGIMGAKVFLEWMDTPEESLELATTYMRIYFCGITFSMLYNFGAAILRAAGDTRGPLLYLTIAGVLNVLLNLLFVIVFQMNVAGVACATSISQAVSAILVVYALYRRTDACKLEFRKIRFYRQQLIKIIRIGLPAGIQGSLFSISNVLIQSSVNSFGSVVLDGNSAAMNIEGFTYTTMNSFHQTALNFTGQNYGAGKFDRIRKILYLTLTYVFLAGALAGGLSYLYAKPLLHIYLPEAEEAVGYGVTRLAYIALPYFLCGLMDVMTGMIRGMGSSVVPMLICILGVCGFRILWIYTIFQQEQYHTLPYLYISYAISWVLTFVTELVVFLFLLRRRQREHDNFLENRSRVTT